MKISSEELASFLKEATRSTYASGDASKVASIRFGSEDYHFEKDNLIYHDTFFGSKDFIGEEVVYKENEPVWAMNYCGHIFDPSVDKDEIYSFLRKALVQDYSDMIPVRGPKEYIDGEWRYVNIPTGSLDRFIGKEEIYFSEALFYQGHYHGGLID